MMRTLIVVLLLIAGILFVLFQLYKFYIQINSTQSKILSDIQKLKKEIHLRYNQQLIDVWEEGIELLSQGYNEKIRSDQFGRITIGCINSIYGEPLIAYAIKDYFGSDDYLVVAQSVNDSFVFTQNGTTTEVKQNGNYLGTIREDHTLVGTSGANVAQIVEKSPEYNLIIESDRDVIHLRNSKNVNNGNQRAFPIVKNLERADREMVLLFFIYDFLVKT